ncbi:PhzF family phenazine biosynthesis protein [Deefgea salmonis]|uniref:PhzF family phenazine biosynthesis protein n=1 Tax=Deefgea salmonis TaxID=2875502 RepID=A0ABS8BMF5_9NEIS|nr:PhzF family phenazine biosynthesis protein [Deefgea salmonis]MCB5196741.1 PhzF family phenazine biosynthesis protein [Deefgea salmonis]
MPQYTFHMLNVFAEKPLAGDPLVVFEVNDIPSTATCQALAYQMGSTEVAFFSPNKKQLQCFTQQYALPFSGRALIGAAAIARHLDAEFKSLLLTDNARQIKIGYSHEEYNFISSAGSTRPYDQSQLALAQALNISVHDLVHPILWVDNGAEQLMIQTRTRQSVLQAQPHPALLAQALDSPKAMVQATIWHRDGELLTARCFSSDPFGVTEDFASGTAAANLASYLLATGVKAPLQLRIEQGHTIQKLISRLCVINIKINPLLQICCSGKVNYLGNGIINL